MNKSLLLRKIQTFRNRPDKGKMLIRSIKKGFQKLQGLDFLQGETTEELQLNPSLSNGYSASNKKHLDQILQRLSLENCSILDFGCGKGYALYLMSKHPFAHIAGVEISPRLFAIAQKNMKKLKLNHIQLHLSDAKDFKDLDRFNAFYLFNPFPEAILTQVIQNILASLQSKPRKIQIIYNLPTHEGLLQKQGFHRTHAFTFGKAPIIGHCSVYSNQPQTEIQATWS
ncbi:MAG TPA: class I SAM-dependent methyltransferase [Caldisericia bacterium]|nr:class I SAM-dependent methyltransferase [Caldisericia bacterium]